MIRVKICGMAGLADVQTCIAAGADALGFIFAQSPRKLSLESGEAQRLTAAAGPFVTVVGVFANDAATLVREAIDGCRLDVLQFSGDETPHFCGSFGRPTILAARGRMFSRDDLRRARAVGVLIDTWLPAQFGGTGRIVDSDSAARTRAAHPGTASILAGGLNPTNVAELIRNAKPDAVDVRTGVERDGCKDPDLVRAFVMAARAALEL